MQAYSNSKSMSWGTIKLDLDWIWPRRARPGSGVDRIRQAFMAHRYIVTLKRVPYTGYYLIFYFVGRTLLYLSYTCVGCRAIGLAHAWVAIPVLVKKCR
jgi:hypothetical protein